MPKPLFYIRCTTCESRLGIHDKNLVGQIVACPKCEGMVLVEPQTPAAEISPKADMRQEEKSVSAAKSSRPASPSFQETLPDVLTSPSAFSSSASAAPHVPRHSLPPPPETKPLAETKPLEEMLFRDEDEAVLSSRMPSGEALADDSAAMPGEEVDAFQEILAKRAELTPAELVLWMVGVGIGVFILMLLAGAFLSRLFSGGGGDEIADVGATPPLVVPVNGDEAGPSGMSPDGALSGREAEPVESRNVSDETPFSEMEEGKENGETSPAEEPEGTDGGLIFSDLGRNLTGGGRVSEGMTPEEPELPGEETADAGETVDAGEMVDGLTMRDAPAGETEEEASVSLPFLPRPKDSHYSESVRRTMIQPANSQEFHGTKAPVAGNSPVSAHASRAEQEGTFQETPAVKKHLPASSMVFLAMEEIPVAEHLSLEVARKLEQPVQRMEVNNSPLSSVVRFVAQAGNMTINADWGGLPGAKATQPVKFTLEDTTLREILETALTECDLGCVMAGRNLRIVGVEAARVAAAAAAVNEKITKTVIPLDDMLATAGGGENSAKFRLTEVMALVEMFVMPGTWAKNGGIGKLSASGRTKIQVEQQFPAVVREIHVFCDKLRLARNLPLRDSENIQQLAARVRSGAEKTSIDSPFILCEKTNKIPVTCDLSDSPSLRDGILTLAYFAGAKIILDEEAVNAVPVTEVLRDAEIPDLEGNLVVPPTVLDIPVTYSFTKVPFSDAMNVLLQPYPILACYPVSSDTYVLTTAEKAKRVQMLVFIRVDDILRSTSASSVLNDIRRNIAPSSWAQKSGDGGVGQIHYDQPSGRFIILQSPQVIFEIHRFLTNLRDKKPPRLTGGAP